MIIQVSTGRHCKRCNVKLYCTRFGPANNPFIPPEEPGSPNVWCHHGSATRECVAKVDMVGNFRDPDDIRKARAAGWTSIPVEHIEYLPIPW